MGADQFSGHASVTDASLNPGATEPVDPRLTVSFQPVLTVLMHPSPPRAPRPCAYSQAQECSVSLGEDGA